MTTIPATAWPTSFPSLQRAQVIERQILWLSPSFLTGYKAKHKNRKVDMMAWLGSVELILDKRHRLTVNTGLASCLFMIDERGKLSNQDLAEQMGGIDPDTMRKLL